MARNEPVNALIVDDDRSTQRLLADALDKQGFTVTVERDGEWALKTFEKKPFDVVLLDLLLPSLNGYEVARQMRALPKGKRTPIVMLSGVYKNAVHAREAVQKHGAFAFLEKPLRLPELYDTLKNALGARYPKPRGATPPPPPHDDDEVTGEHHLVDEQARAEASTVEKHSSTAGRFQLIKGEFQHKPFAEVLAEIYRWQGTGALLLRREKVKKIVYFRDGRPVSLKSNLLSECLGRVMIREKMISEQECEESLRRMQQTKRQQGTVLIEMGCISPHNLQHALQLQLQTKLFDVFIWETGDYQFNPKAAVPAEPVDLGMTTAQAIYEGIKNAYDDERLAKALGDNAANLYAHSSSHPLYALQDAGLGDEEQQLLAAIDGHKTVATLRALSILPPLETDRLLFAMKCAQMIELREKPSEGRLRSSAIESARSARPPPLPPRPPMASAPKAQALPWEHAASHEARPKAPGKRASGRHEPLPPPIPGPSVLARAASPLLPELGAGGVKVGGDEGAMRERLAAKVAAMRRLDYFEILGLPHSANREDVKRAYFALAKEYHPDKHFGSSSAEVRQLAQQMYDLISSAHDTLADPIERERYMRDLAQGVKREMGDEVGKILAAEGKFQRGEELMRQRDYVSAYRHFADAITLYPEEGEFHAWLGWAHFQTNPQDEATLAEAINHIEKAVSLNPKLDKSYLFLGYIHKASGRPDKAEKQFEKAIQCNPDCTEALRELRLLGKGRR